MLDNKIKYGRLKLIDSFINPNKSYARYWNCECDCGKKKVIREDAIRLKKTTSCGCFCVEVHWKGYGEISGDYWSRCEYGASTRKIKFDVSIESAWNVFLNQNRKCYLTGREIKFVRNYSLDNLLQTASLDRKDSKSYYNINNICWLHKDMNIFKGSMHTDDFIKLCQEVVLAHPSGSSLETLDTFSVY